MYLPFLLLSFAIIQSLHVYLLITQRHNRQWSISVHAAKNRQTHLIYFVGHVLGEVCILIFAKLFYLDMNNLPFLFGFVGFVVTMDFIQALLPVKGKTDTAHSLAAYVMWVGFISTGVLGVLLIDAMVLQKVTAAAFLIATLAMFAYVHANHSKLYFYQILMTATVFCSLITMAL